MKTVMTVLAIAALCVCAWAAGNTVIAPQSSASHKPQAITYGTESITTPQMLSYQGKLTDTLGQPVPNNDYSVAFKLYTVPSGGSAFWNETQSVTTKGGLFSVLLGSVAQIESVPSSGNLYLGMAVAGGAELSPRLRLVGSAYSYLAAKSANSDLLQGKDTTGFVRTGQANSVTSNMIVNGTIAATDLGQMGASTGQVMKWTGSAWAPRNDSVGSGGTGTVTSVSQATGVKCTPNPITTTGTVGLDTTYSDGRYIKNQSSAYQTGSWKILGRGTDSLVDTTTTGLAAIYGRATGLNYGVWGNCDSGPGVNATCSGEYGALQGVNYATSNAGYTAGVAGHGWYAKGAYGVYGDGYNNGVVGVSTGSNGVYGTASAAGTAGVYGASTATDTGHCTGVYGFTPAYWGVQGYRQDNAHNGTGYGVWSTRGGLFGYTYYGDTWTFGTAGYTYGDYRRTGGVIGALYTAGVWGSLGYLNSAGNWYAGYGTSAWQNGTGLGIGCGYGGGLMGGWLKGKYYGATVSGDRYALYTKGNNYTSGYSAEMHNTGGRREATYVATSTNVDIYTLGVAEMKGGQASVSFPASFAATVSKDVPVVVTATPMGPAPIYLSSSDNNGFTVAAVDAKASVKFSWIAVGRQAGYEKNPDVPAELTKTDFDSKMDGVMSDENDLSHPAQPVWFDGTQLRFDNPPEEPRPPKPAQPVMMGLNTPPAEPARVVPAGSVAPSTAPTPSTTTAPVPRPSSTQAMGVDK
jgi:hypothetical protein